jgi:hypothetical protein
MHAYLGRIHGEFLRLLFFLANKKADDYFEALIPPPFPSDISRTSKSSVTVAVSSSSKATWPTTSMTAMSATSSTSPR